MLTNIAMYGIAFLFYAVLAWQVRNGRESFSSSHKMAEYLVFALKFGVGIWAIYEITNPANNYVPWYRGRFSSNTGAVSYNMSAFYDFTFGIAYFRFVLMTVMASLLVLFKIFGSKHFENQYFVSHASTDFTPMQKCGVCQEDFNEQDPRLLITVSCPERHICHESCVDLIQLQTFRKCSACEREAKQA